MTTFTTGLINLNKALGPEALTVGRSTGFFGLGNSYRTQSLIDLIAASAMFGERVPNKLINLIFVTNDESPMEIYDRLFDRIALEVEDFGLTEASAAAHVCTWALEKGYRIQVLNLTGGYNLLELTDKIVETVSKYSSDETPSLVCVDNFERYISEVKMERPQRFIARSLRSLGSAINAHIALSGRFGQQADWVRTMSNTLASYLMGLSNESGPYLENYIDQEFDNVIATGLGPTGAGVRVLKCRSGIHRLEDGVCHYNDENEFTMEQP